MDPDVKGGSMNMDERFAMEAKKFGEPTNPEPDEVKAGTEENEVIVSNPEPDKVEATEQVTEAPKKKRTNWKAKFEESQRRMAGIKASSDSFKHSTRNEIELLKQQVEILKTKPEVPVDPFEDVFTEEDTDTIGTEAVDIIKRASQRASEAQVNPLKEEIARLKREKAQADQMAAQNSAESEYAVFENALTDQVENWRELNTDPEFLQYLGEVNSASGYTRGDLLRRAEQSRDVDRVAFFMNEFLTTKGPEDKLADQVSPTGSPSASTVREDKVESMPASYIDKFYEDSIRGVYKSKPGLAAEIQNKINIALSKPGGVDPKR